MHEQEVNVALVIDFCKPGKGMAGIRNENTLPP